MMRCCLTMLESSFALFQFGWDSDEYRQASAQSRRLEEEKMKREMDKMMYEEQITNRR
jgi:hypothetical protein